MRTTSANRPAALFLCLVCSCSAAPLAPSGEQPTTATATVAPISEPDRSLHFVVQGFSRGEVAWAPDNRHIAVVNDGVAIVDTNDGSVKARFPGCATAAAFSLDGMKLVTVGCASEPSRATWIGIDYAPVPVSLWNLEDDTVREIMRGRFQSVTVDTEGLATATGQGEIALIDVAQGRVLMSRVGKPDYQGGPNTLMPPPYFVHGPLLVLGETVIDPNGEESTRSLGSLSPDGKTTLIDGGMGPVGGPYRPLPELAACTQTWVNWAADSEKLTLECFDGRQGVSTRTQFVVEKSGRVRCALPPASDFLWSRDGTRVATTSSDMNSRESTLVLLSATDCTPIQTIERRGAGYVWSPDLSRIAGPDYNDNSIALIDTSTGSVRSLAARPSPTLFGEASPVEQDISSIVSVVSKGKHTPLGSADAKPPPGALLAIDDTPITLAQSQAYAVRRTTVMISAERQLIFTKWASTTSIWNLEGKLLLATPDGDELVIDPTEKHVLEIGDKTTSYDLTTGKKRWSLDTPKPTDPEAVQVPQWSNRGSLLAMTRKGVLDLDGKLLWAADHFPTDPWSPDDAVVLTYGSDFRDSCNARVVGEMHVRNAQTGAELAALPGAVYVLGWSNPYLLTKDGCGGTLVQLWDTKTWQLHSSHRLRSGRYFTDDAATEAAASALGLPGLSPEAREQLTGAQVTPDGKRLLYQGAEDYRQLRLEDLALLRSYSAPGGASFLHVDAEERFDGDDDALALARFRVGANVFEGSLVAYRAVKPNARCRGLLQDFLGGRAATCGKTP